MTSVSVQRQNSNTYDSASRVSFDLPRKYREEEGTSKKTLLAGKTRTEQYADTQANQLRNPRFQLIKKSIPEHGYVYMSLKKWGAGGVERLISGYYCLRENSLGRSGGDVRKNYFLSTSKPAS